MMTGGYAGKIRDIKPIYARQMIADGRALDPNAPIAETEPVVLVVVAPVVVPVEKVAGRKASRR